MKPCELCRSYIIDSLLHPNHKTDDLYYLVTTKHLHTHIYKLSHSILRLQRTISYDTLHQIKEYISIDLFLDNVKHPTKQDRYRYMYKHLKKRELCYEELQHLEIELVDNGIVKIPEGDKSFLTLQLFIELSILPLLEELISLHHDHSIKNPIEYYDPYQKPKQGNSSFKTRISRTIEDEDGNLYD